LGVPLALCPLLPVSAAAKPRGTGPDCTLCSRSGGHLSGLPAVAFLRLPAVSRAASLARATPTFASPLVAELGTSDSTRCASSVLMHKRLTLTVHGSRFTVPGSRLMADRARRGELQRSTIQRSHQLEPSLIAATRGPAAAALAHLGPGGGACSARRTAPALEHQDGACLDAARHGARGSTSAVRVRETRRARSRRQNRSFPASCSAPRRFALKRSRHQPATRTSRLLAQVAPHR